MIADRQNAVGDSINNRPSELRTSALLAWAILLFGVASAAVTAWIVYRTYSPVLFYDQWDFINEFMASGGRLSLVDLWTQHNEHRIPLGKLASWADLTFFGGRNVSLLIEIYLIQISQSALWIAVVRKYGGFSNAQMITISGFIIFCMFYPIQIENFYWGFQVAFVSLPLGASVAFAGLISHADSSAKRRPPAWISGALLVSLAGAAIAECGLASGMLVWPMLVLLSFALRLRKATQLFISSVGAVAVGGFLLGFHSPSQTAKPVDSLRHPLAVGKYVRAYLAYSWDPGQPNNNLWPTFAQWCTTLAVAAILIFFLRVMTARTPPKPLPAFLLFNAIFLFCTSLVTALGRINFGIGQATASRYQTIALTFWAAFLALVLVWRVAENQHPVRLIEIQVVALSLILAGVPRFVDSLNVAKSHQQALAGAYVALVRNPNDAQALAQISPFPNFAEAHAFLQLHHLGIDDRQIAGLGDVRPIGSSEGFRMNGFTVVGSGNCVGFLDNVIPDLRQPSRVRASGWAWNLDPPGRPPRVLLISSDGTVIGSSEVSLLRQDVPNGVPSVKSTTSGWAIEAKVPPGARLRAFALTADSSSVCPLAMEFVQAAVH